MNAFEKLAQAVQEKNSHLVLGLDPDISELPPSTPIADYLKGIIDDIQDQIVAVKPNLAFYEDENVGTDILADVCSHARAKGLLVILDSKRGDIMNTQKHYAKADLEHYRPDIVTLNPYMGAADVINPYLEAHPDVCVFPIIATSNAAARVIQNIDAGGLSVYQQMVLNVRQACAPERVGYVVGATKAQEMRQIRALELEKGMDQAWVLAPGFGKQGADLSFLNYAGQNVVFPISSGLTHPKYLNGKTPRGAAAHWNQAFNDALRQPQDMRSISDLWAENLLTGAYIKTAPSPDESSWFTLKNGTKSPVYANMRDLQSDPKLLLTTAWLMKEEIEKADMSFDRIAAVPYGALGLAYALASIMGKPVVTPRKEGAKDHGTKDEIVGAFKDGEKVLIVEDVATSGGSTIETAEKLRGKGLDITDACVVVDREQGAAQKLAEQGIKLHRLTTLDKAFSAALRDDNPMKRVVRDYLARTRQG